MMPKSKVGDSKLKSSRVCLEFANTLRWHASEHTEETLHSYRELVAWARGVRLVSHSKARKLLRDATGRPAKASQVLERAIALRETIYRIFVALIHGKSPAEDDLAKLNDTLTTMTSGARIVETAEGFAWCWDVDEDALDSLIWPIALSAAELLTCEDRKRVGQCADDRGCGWLFLDNSKNHSRRWCDIDDCGNRAKQRRRYARTLGRAKPTRR
jgi:predicted RNA-binding Zn ribbon-like protein